MANQYYDSDFQSGEDIDGILEAVNALRTSTNAGKVVAITNAGELTAVDPDTLFTDGDSVSY